jgi:sugar diacid utilization regulator
VLAEVLDGRLGIHEPGGELLAGTGAADGWQRGVADSVASGHSVEVDGTYVATALAGTEHVASLVLHGRGRPLALGERRTLERGALVTALVLLFARTVAQTEERLGGELLVDLLEGGSFTDLLRERARRQQVVLEPPLTVAVAAIDGIDRHTAVRAAVRLAATHRGLAGEHRGAVVLLLPSDEPLAVGRRLRDAVGRLGGTATVGVHLTGESLRSSYVEARRCLDSLVTLGRLGDVSDPAGLGLTRLLLGENGPEEMGEYVEVTLGPVLAYDAQRGTSLVGTLEAWFATGGRVKDTGERLHVHPNTVVQRLDRIGELLGADWRDSERSLDVQLALRVHRLRGTG